MTRLAVWIGIAALDIYLWVIGGGWAGIYSTPVRFVTMVLTAILLSGWAIVAIRAPFWRPRSLLLAPILICLGSLAASTIFSREPRVSLEYLGYGVVLATLYLLLVRLLAHEFFRPRLVRLQVALFAVLAVEYIAIVGSLWLQWWADIGGFAPPPLRPYFESLSYGNPSAVLTEVALLAVPGAAVIAGWRRQRIIGWTLLGATVALVALISGSRAGWFALGLTAVLGATAFGSSRERRALFLHRLDTGAMYSPVRRLALVGAAIAVVGVGVIAGPAILVRLNSGGEDLRAEYAVVAIRAFASSPVVGTGPGTWVIGRLALTQAGEPDYYVPHAHDVPVQVLAELGIVGGLAGAVLIGFVLLLLRRAWRSSDADLRRWVWPTTLGLLYLAFHDLLDFYPNMPAVLFAAALPVAYIDAGLQNNAEAPLARARIVTPTAVQRLARGLAGLGVICALAGLLLTEIPATTADRAVAAANRGAWADAVEPALDAARADPTISPYQFIAGLVEDRVGDHTAAAASFQRVATQDDLPEAWLNLAAEQLELGRSDAALESIERALRLGNQRAIIGMAAGDLALRLGSVAIAEDSFARAIALWPSLAGDPWWQRPADRSALYPSVLARATALAGPANAWELDLFAAKPVSAVEIAASNRPDLAPIVVAAWNGDAAKATSLYIVCRAQPTDVVAVLWCARIAWRAGDQALAWRWRSVAEGEAPASTGVTFELRVDPNPAPDRVLGGDPAVFWSTFTYRRSMPNDMLVPSLVHLTYR